VVHADLSQRVAIATATLPWTRRDDGIEEKLLELARTGPPGQDELRRTAIVRLPAGGRLPVAPEGGLDVLVLEGVLEHAGLRLGFGGYLRCPAEPLASATPCTLFVKQRPGRAIGHHTTDTTTVAFAPAHAPGLWRALLHSDEHGDVVLLGFDPGTTIDHHHHDRGEEFFVLAGEIRDELGSYGVHHWVRQPTDSAHAVETAAGCLFFTFAHHLPPHLPPR
jgi:hypothetical protein